jgi:hypothetical protein
MNLRLVSIFFALLTALCATNAAAASPFSPISIGIRSALASRTNNDLGGSSKSIGSRNGYKKQHQIEKQSIFAVAPTMETDFRGGANVVINKPPALLKWAYSACGFATTAAWSTCVYIAIRSNQPMGAVMPSWQHGVFARIGALSTVPLILASYKTLVSASDDWEELSSPTCRRQNLAIATATAGSALWVKYAHIITQIPGTEPLVSHIGFSGPSSLPRTALIAAYGSAAALSAAVWVRSLPEEDRKNPFSWPGRVVDGVAKSLVSLAPASTIDPVQVKYSLLASGFLFFTGMQLCAQHPTSAVYSWTARRLPRAFPAWTLLASATAYDLKEAAESGRLLTETSYRDLSNSIKGFGALYLVGKIGPVLFDPSWPGGFKVPTAVPGWAMAAIITMAYTLRSDKQ